MTKQQDKSRVNAAPDHAQSDAEYDALNAAYHRSTLRKLDSERCLSEHCRYCQVEP